MHSFVESKPRFIARIRKSDGAEQNLWDHLQQTARLAATYADKVGLGSIGELVGLLHDIGKATEEFDQYIRECGRASKPEDAGEIHSIPQRGEVDHSTAGAQILRELLSTHSSNLFTADILPLLIASHHSGLIDCLAPSGENRLGKRLGKDPMLTRKNEAWNNLDEAIRSRVISLLNDDIEASLRRVIRSMVNEGLDGQKEIYFKIGLLVRFLFSALIDADRLDSADFELRDGRSLRHHGKYPPWKDLINALESRLSKFSEERDIDRLRKEVSDQCKRMASGERGVYRLTVPTGGGKTLASLRFALHHAQEHNMDRVFYIIPYISIIDQNAQVIREILDPKASTDKISSIVLEHHSNLTPEVEMSEQHRLLAENWDAPVVLTTMVQFLETLFGAGTRGCRRMHQLANAVIIFDEIQTIPIRCVHLFNVALQFLVEGCGATVLLCTATQPLLDQVKPENRALPIRHEITPNFQQLYRELRRVNVINMFQAGGWSSAEVASLAIEEMKAHRSVLIVVNTKRAAALIYNDIREQSDVPTYHLSTNMCPAHRLNVLQKVRNLLEKNKPVICVSTQLIEAGVDIDFAVVIRSLAGLDSITQAAGRCNRHNSRPELGRLVLINPSFEHIDKLPDIRRGREITERILHEFAHDPAFFDDDLLGPIALERYFKYYFHDRQGEMNYPVDGNSVIGRSDALYDLLSTNPKSVQEFQRIHGTSPPLVIRQSFMSAARAFAAIDQSGQGVIVPYEEGEEIISALCGDIEPEERYALLRKAQRYSVNLHRYELKRHFHQLRGAIFEAGVGSGIYCLDKRYYDSKLGFHTNTTELMEILIT